MTKSLSDIDPNVLHVGIQGASGTGKTRLAGTLSCAGQKMYWFNLDGNLSSLLQLPIPDGTFFYDDYFNDWKGSGPKRRLVKSAWDKVEDQIVGFEGGDIPWEYDGIVIDSLTTLELSVATKVAAMNGQQYPKFKDWGIIVPMMTQFLSQLNQFEFWRDKHVVILCHERLVEEEGQPTMFVPALHGKHLAAQFPALFTEFYRTTVDKDRKSGEYSYRIHTKSSDKWTAKTGLPLEPVEEPDFRVILKKAKEGG